MPAPRKYPLELRERAVRMCRAAEPKPVIRRMAEELGVHHEALRNWIRQAEGVTGERDDILTTAEREELAALRKENAQLKRANEVLRTASAFFRGPARPDPAQVTTLIDEHPHLGVEPVLRELPIPSSTYYRWRQAEKGPCRRHRQDAEQTDMIRQVHADSGGTYGSPRVHAVLKCEGGVHVGCKRVERLMRQAGLASPRRGKGFTRRDPDAGLAPDLVQRDFTADEPNWLWVTDLTMITTLESPPWLSSIRDAFSCRAVAWETSARADADLVLTVLEYALASREAAPGELIHHVDHGPQYTSVRLTHAWSGQVSRRPWARSATRSTTPSRRESHPGERAALTERREPRIGTPPRK
ncbi:IS3 family transposase [Streptomyces flaveolus]|uniref:IS3 family transposase n=1 Tax=Streptomyces flaveolus TaxID=67297 RepID=UPI0033C8F2C5